MLFLGKRIRCGKVCTFCYAKMNIQEKPKIKDAEKSRHKIGTLICNIKLKVVSKYMMKKGF